MKSTYFTSILAGMVLAFSGLLTVQSHAASPTGKMPTLVTGDGVVVKVRGCHRSVRGRGNRKHVHRGSNCRRVAVRNSRRHCHRSVRAHRGNRNLHRHVGRNCNARRVHRENRRFRNRNCVSVGIVRFCEG